MTDEELTRWRLSWTSSSHPDETMCREATPQYPRDSSHPIPLGNVFREDVPVYPHPGRGAPAPPTQDGKFRVPAILDEDWGEQPSERTDQLTAAEAAEKARIRRNHLRPSSPRHLDRIAATDGALSDNRAKTAAERPLNAFLHINAE